MSSWVEPEWDDEQVDLVVAEGIIRANTGPNGEWMPEATDGDLMDPNAYSGVTYVAEGPLTNWAEKIRRDAEEAHRKLLGEDANMNGVYFTVRKVDHRSSE